MKYIIKNCPNCDANLLISPENNQTVCKNCKMTFNLASLISEKDKIFFNSLEDEKIEKSLKYNGFIMQGNENLKNGFFARAEENFKQAIDLDETRYEGYFGVCKAKTQNLKTIPKTSDYREYAKIAMSLAGIDEKASINAELAKLDMLS